MKSLPTLVMAVHSNKRTADRSKPKVKLDGTPDPNCLTCKKKHPPTT